MLIPNPPISRTGLSDIGPPDADSLIGKRQGIVFERLILQIVKYIFHKNKEAKSSEVGTTENERRYNALHFTILELSKNIIGAKASSAYQYSYI